MLDIPFNFMPISRDAPEPFKEGQILSTLDHCGIFLCRAGEIEISMGDKPYRMKRGDIYLYMPSTLVRLLHESKDAEGIIVEVALDYAIPIVNKVVNVESLLFLREHPCVSLSTEQFKHLECLFEGLHDRIQNEDVSGMSTQCKCLTLELVKSMGQTLCYEVLNAYFINQPLQPLPQGKKDLIFQNFMLMLFRHYRHERDVAFYAKMQHLSARYFSTIIRDKSGSNALQWIVQMVITEAKLLLEDSDLSIKEISNRLNFPTQSFFGKYFKQYVGISPKEYRNRLIGS